LKTKREKEKRKKNEQGLKSKRVETSYEKLHVSKGEKKKRMKFTSYWDSSIERKQERISHFSIVQNSICGLIHTNISFAFALSSIP
jgi:hypothetical protein